MAMVEDLLCVALSEMASSSTHGEDSPYFTGWRAYDEDPYDPESNPSGVIQMGLAENQVINLLIQEELTAIINMLDSLTIAF